MSQFGEVPPPPETATHPRLGPPPVRLPEQTRVALVTGSGPQLSGEIRDLLHRRLRIGSLIAAVGFAPFLLKNLLEGQSDDHFGLAILAGTTTTLAAVAAIFWSRRSFSLRQLRALELVAVAAGSTFFAWFQADAFAMGGTPTAPPGPSGWAELESIADACTLRWFAGIVIYGIFIPNTWRRCAAVVSALVAIPMFLIFGVSLRYGTSSDLVGAQMEMGFWLGLAAAIAIIGSHRIGELRRQAFEGRKLGQYRLVRRLGDGAMGEVFLAEHPMLRRPCALKVIRPEQAGDPTTLLRFEAEVQATASLSHWNIIKIFDFGRAEDGTFYYVMEYLAGQNLQELVTARGPIPPARAIHLLRQVCAALREAHAIGLIHRDIKPSNIIACRMGSVCDVAVLLDFGIVRSAGPVDLPPGLTQEGYLVGTPDYMSPEQARGSEGLDARSDLYSLGAVAYYLLTGRPPFVLGRAMEVLAAQIHVPPPPLTDLRPEIPDDLQGVVLRCLEKRPDSRYPDARALDDALARCRDSGRWTEEQAAACWTARDDRADFPPRPL